MKRLLHTIIAIMAIGMFISCEKNEMEGGRLPVPEGHMPVNITFTAPDMLQVNTKAVDPDGKGINKMTLFCFDNFGMFISYVDNVNITSTPGSSGYSLEGTINEVSIPENTRRIHFVANQNMTTFNEDQFRGMSEYDVAAKLEGSSGMMVYWGYFTAEGVEISDSEDFKNALEAAHGTGGSATPVRMLRNQARFTVNAGSTFVKTGFTVVNTCAFGTVAPYHPEKGFKFSMITSGSGNSETWQPCDWTDTDFITLPHNTTRLSPPADIDIADETCVFETDNNSGNPVSIIIKGKNNDSAEELYYRVILMDEDGNYIKVRRNFHYTINITGDLSYGQATFDAALTAPATNNIWLSIDDEVNEVSNSQFTLSVDETSIVVLATNIGTEDAPEWELSKPATGLDYDLVGNQVDLGYRLAKSSGNLTAEDKPEASWIEGSAVSSSDVYNDYILHTNQNYSDSEVTVWLNSLDGLKENAQIEGTILIKRGVLQRKIKVIVLKQMKFVPLWVSTQVNMAANSNVNLLFTIPESCPDELLPFDVYISANHLDIRHTSGRSFPIITKITDPEHYGEDTYAQYDQNGDPVSGTLIGYKYVYTVTQKGDQRVYFSNTIDRSESAGNLSEYITLESPYFITEKKAFTFNTKGDYRIEMPGVNIYTPSSTAEEEGNVSGDVSQFSPDEQIKYILVPQKLNATVELDLAFTHYENETISDLEKVGDYDEFLFYSENLMHLHGHYGGTDYIGGQCDCQFMDIDTVKWSSGGKVHAFRFMKDGAVPNATDKSFTTSEGTKNRKVYTLKMKTTKAKSEEVVRISSNHTGSVAAFGNGTQTYNGNTYRSFIFELANYRAFRFAAQIQVGRSEAVGDTGKSGLEEESTDQLMLDYAPNQDVKVNFDITSFAGSDGKQVDPFGSPFYVYIVAPMLELPESLTEIQKGKLFEVKEGVFAYKADGDRDTEKTSSFLTNNERKALPFVKKDVVTDGEILITTNPELAGVTGVEAKDGDPSHSQQIVVFYDKKFKVGNNPIAGTIKYGTNGTENNVPAGSFVTFSLVKNNSRIGSMSVTADGSYSLRLRQEYDFIWNDDDIRIDYTAPDGKVYEAEFTSLENLNASKTINLKLKQE